MLRQLALAVLLSGSALAQTAVFAENRFEGIPKFPTLPHLACWFQSIDHARGVKKVVGCDRACRMKAPQPDFPSRIANASDRDAKTTACSNSTRSGGLRAIASGVQHEDRQAALARYSITD